MINNLMALLDANEREDILWRWSRATDGEFNWQAFYETFACELVPSELIPYCIEMIVGATGPTPVQAVLGLFEFPTAKAGFEAAKYSSGAEEWDFQDDSTVYASWSGGWA